MRIRKKLIFLHTMFSVALAAVLLIALRPAVGRVVTRAESDEAVLVLVLMSESDRAAGGRWGSVTVRTGTRVELGLRAGDAGAARAARGAPVPVVVGRSGGAVSLLEAEGAGSGEGVASEPVYVLARSSIPGARRAVLELYAFVVAAVVGVYVLIAAALELFVLPQNVYGPIRRMLDAEHALQRGDHGREIIAEAEIPADELGEIMRSRNESVRSLRRHERDLAAALQELERVATDLKRKNHLIEAARRNLADADRLASLGMMSAGIAHELNTPLTVVKGLADRLNADPEHRLSAQDAALLARVVGRLERLGESLLDFARVRPPQHAPACLADLVAEAATLVRLDRDTRSVQILPGVDPALIVRCDADRIVQVLVNLIRNAVDAVRSGRPGGVGRVTVAAEPIRRDGSAWVSLTVTDDGPGIDPELLASLFEPFVSSRLDAKGTGLGLAVAEGIVREHGGLILARNREGQPGAVFEVVLPAAEGSGSLGAEGRDERSIG
jgi:two-component system NtrC family sensor kinase